MSSPNQKHRPRSRSVLSFGSSKSSDSKPKVTKAELVEAAKEKTYKRMSTKANPNIAVDELEPGAAQAFEKATVQSNLRSMSFVDQFGNPITDPDRSNPTRPRLERPLDTIRSFEAAIDGSYNRRLSRISGAFINAFIPPFAGSEKNTYEYSYQVSEPMTPAQSRPSSFYPGMNGNFGQGFPGNGNNYGNRMAPSRPESYIDPYGNTYGHQPPPRSPMPFGRPRRNYGSRNNSDPIIYGNNGHPMYGDQKRENNNQTYDTSTQGSGSGGSHGTEPWSNSTDPSSEASSVERFQQPPPPPKPDLGEQYGFSGFGGAPQGLDNRNNPSMNGHGGNGLDRRPQMSQDDIPPPPPPHLSNNPPRQPVRANTLRKQMNPSSPEAQSPIKRTDTSEKRKSWLMRRFSRNS